MKEAKPINRDSEDEKGRRGEGVKKRAKENDYDTEGVEYQ